MYEPSKSLIANTRLVLLGTQAFVDSAEKLVDYWQTGTLTEPDDMFGNPEEEAESNHRRVLGAELTAAMVRFADVLKTLERGHVGELTRKVGKWAVGE